MYALNGSEMKWRQEPFRGAWRELVHLVRLVHFVCLVQRTKQQDKLNKLDKPAWLPLTQGSHIIYRVMDTPATLQ